jgi:iron complex transport system ATP-binding protein
MALLQLEDIALGYGSHVVVSGINLEVMPGEVLGLIGPNGSGKSTLLKGVSHVLTPLSGRVLIKGWDVAAITRSELARILAVVPQNAVLPEAFTAFEIVLMGRTPHLGLFRYEGHEDMSITWQAMGVTGTQHLAERRVGELSGGERQRLIIAKALAQEPELILLDEPTAQLDIKYQIEVLDLIRELCVEEGLMAVAAIHDLNLASQYCNCLVMLNGGGIHAQGSPEAVITAQNIREVYGAEVHIYPHPINALPTTLITPSDGKRAMLEGIEKSSSP